MNKYVKKYRMIVDELIEKSFPRLRGRKFLIKELNLRNITASTIKFPFFNVINLSFRARKYSKKLLVGILAHELSHLEGWEIHRLDYYFIFPFKRMSKKFLIKNEWDTDKYAIDRGYARPLYAQRKSRWTILSINTKIKNRYASPEKIKSYAKKIGRWH